MLPAKPRYLLATKASCVMSAYNPNQTLAEANSNSVALADKASAVALAVNRAQQWHRMSQVTRRTDSCSSIRQNWRCIINPIQSLRTTSRVWSVPALSPQGILGVVHHIIINKGCSSEAFTASLKTKRNQGCSGAVALNDDIMDREAAVREWWCCTSDSG